MGLQLLNLGMLHILFLLLFSASAFAEIIDSQQGLYTSGLATQEWMRNLAPGTEVTVLKRYKYWAKVQLGDGTRGFVNIASVKSPPWKASDITCVMETSQNFYDTSGVNKQKLGIIDAGKIFRIIENQEEYSHVQRMDGKIGYVSKLDALLSCKEKAEQVTAIEAVATTPGFCADCEHDTVQSTRAMAETARGILDIVDAAHAEIERSASSEINLSYADLLTKWAKKRAVACRRPSDSVRKRLRKQGKSDEVLCGDISKGRCKEGVTEALFKAKLTDGYLPGESAISTVRGGHLLAAGFIDIAPQGYNEHNAPYGSILVYKGGDYGHIEIRTTDNKYCSDFCNIEPISERLNRKLVGVFIKPEGSQ